MSLEISEDEDKMCTVQSDDDEDKVLKYDSESDNQRVVMDSSNSMKHNYHTNQSAYSYKTRDYKDQA